MMNIGGRMYRKGNFTKEYSLSYPWKGKFDLSIFTDIDWIGNIDDSKGTIGGAFFLGGRLVTWTNKK